MRRLFARPSSSALAADPNLWHSQLWYPPDKPLIPVMIRKICITCGPHGCTILHNLTALKAGSFSVPNGIALTGRNPPSEPEIHSFCEARNQQSAMPGVIGGQLVVFNGALDNIILFDMELLPGQGCLVRAHTPGEILNASFIWEEDDLVV